MRDSRLNQAQTDAPPNDFVEIIHDLRRIDVHATNFLTLTPYDGLVRKSYHYESKGTLFLDSQPVEWVNKNMTNKHPSNHFFPLGHRVPGVDWYDRYSFGISDPRLVGTPEVPPQTNQLKLFACVVKRVLTTNNVTSARTIFRPSEIRRWYNYRNLDRSTFRLLKTGANGKAMITGQV